ncbi:MAG: hypothetical protein SNJ78_09815, partial [Spirochaetales bacterium]
IHYYLTLFPVEALISSQLAPHAFGSYMATGSKKGSFENIIFIEVEGEFGNQFDWQYAKERCVPHPDGRPKNSLYLSVYRTLENIPLSVMRSLFLTTRDGRSLELTGEELKEHPPKRTVWVYQELCPIRPLAVSTLDPLEFSQYMADPSNKTWVPKIVFADLKVINFSNSDTGSIGPAYDRNLEHLQDCIREVTEQKQKPNKIVDRSNVDRFSYQIIQDGIYVGDKEKVLFYRMKSLTELRQYHYDWARSAMIL